MVFYMQGSEEVVVLHNTSMADMIVRLSYLAGGRLAPLEPRRQPVAAALLRPRAVVRCCVLLQESLRERRYLHSARTIA